ncbi:hypothetical protein [Mucilaginibacter ginkgonis]|uniref:Uncharacterized protein n=1 Tax=Mucilaginibacter ginkgonis TaxID=2682091 RepID=A0A6I4I0Z5_9SPHI|nr:hypothetical protein [Mucilaginibacter ginkgonis]QQL48780.1 hypothetical protein GO620_011390 [Mucilaginibacter ginkgonis]
MKKSFLSKSLLRYAAALTFMAALIYGCKKELSTGALVAATTSEARTWYENTYPKLAVSAKASQSMSDLPDYSQLLQPDWDKAVIYKRFGQDVTEVSVGAESNLLSALKI